jgi:hypothetical protein
VKHNHVVFVQSMFVTGFQVIYDPRLQIIVYFYVLFGRESRYVRVMKLIWHTIYLQFIESLYLYLFRVC